MPSERRRLQEVSGEDDSVEDEVQEAFEFVDEEEDVEESPCGPFYPTTGTPECSSLFV